jgi:hypothetical protein
LYLVKRLQVPTNVPWVTSFSLNPAIGRANAKCQLRAVPVRPAILFRGDGEMGIEHGRNVTGKTKRRTCPIIIFIQNSTHTSLGLNSGSRSEKLEAGHLSCGNIYSISCKYAYF